MTKKYEYWITDEGLRLIEAWARDGLTDEEISNKMEISRKTLWKWKEQFSSVSNALKKGKEVVDIEVENALLRKALNGDITAMIFWLKNRRPEKWRDKPKETITSDVIVKIVEDV